MPIGRLELRGMRRGFRGSGVSEDPTWFSPVRDTTASTWGMYSSTVRCFGNVLKSLACGKRGGLRSISQRRAGESTNRGQFERRALRQVALRRMIDGAARKRVEKQYSVLEQS